VIWTSWRHHQKRKTKIYPQLYAAIVSNAQSRNSGSRTENERTNERQKRTVISPQPLVLWMSWRYHQKRKTKVYLLLYATIVSTAQRRNRGSRTENSCKY
jgi:hypothetical protein